MYALQSEDSASFLQRTYGVDEATIKRVRSTSRKQFLMDVPEREEKSRGMCLPSGAWLKFCGFREKDVTGKTPNQIIQGPLTATKHIDEMRSFLDAYDINQQVQCAEPSRLVVNNLVNYRRVHKHLEDDLSTTSSFTMVPFKFKLTIQLLKSEATGRHFRVWEAIMQDESDLSPQEIARLSAKQATPGPGQRKRTVQRMLKNPIAKAAAGRTTSVVEAVTCSESSLALALDSSLQPVMKQEWSRAGEFVSGLHTSETCFACGSASEPAATTKQSLQKCLEDLGGHCTPSPKSPWSIDGTVYVRHAPIHFTLVLCKAQPSKSIGVPPPCMAAMSRHSGDPLSFLEFCSKVKHAYANACSARDSTSPLSLSRLMVSPMSAGSVGSRSDGSRSDGSGTRRLAPQQHHTHPFATTDILGTRRTSDTKDTLSQSSSTSMDLDVDNFDIGIDIDSIMEMANWSSQDSQDSHGSQQGNGGPASSTGSTSVVSLSRSVSGGATDSDQGDEELQREGRERTEAEAAEANASSQVQFHSRTDKHIVGAGASAAANDQQQQRSQSQSQRDQEMMEAYVQMVDSAFMHPAMRQEAAAHLAELCGHEEPATGARYRAVFLRVGVEEGFAPGDVLRTMLEDADPQLHRCAVAILLHLVRGASDGESSGESVAASGASGDGDAMADAMEGVEEGTAACAAACASSIRPAVRELCMQLHGDVRSITVQAERGEVHNSVHPETRRLASELLPLMQRLIS